MSGLEGSSQNASPNAVLNLLDQMEKPDRQQLFRRYSAQSRIEVRQKLHDERGWTGQQIDSYFDLRPDAGPKGKGRPKAESRGIWGVDSLEWYREHYQGLTPTQLRAANRALHRDMEVRGEFIHIPRFEAYGGDALAYYREKYPDVTRGKLQLIDAALYQYMRITGLLEHVPLRELYGEDPLEYYRTNYEGVTRGQLAEQAPEFYMYLYRRGLHTEIPLQLERPAVRGPYKKKDES